MKKLLLMCAFVMGISAMCFAQGGGGGGGRGGFGGTPAQQVDRLKTQIAPLTLTDDQVAKLTVVYTAQTKTMDSIRTAANGDFSSVRPAFTAMMATTTAKINAILTADQAAAYKKAVDAMRARMQQGGGN